jgi:hypothetical protein
VTAETCSDVGVNALKVIIRVLLLVSLGAMRPQSPAGPAIAIEGERFTVNGSTRFLIFVSYFDALHAKSTTWTTDLDYLRQHVHGVRILPNWFADYCAGGQSGSNMRSNGTLIRFDGSVNDETLARLIEFIKTAGERSMIVDVTFTRETVLVPNGQSDPMPFTNYLTAIRRIAEALIPYRNVLFDVQNEWQNKHFSEDEMRRLVTAVHEVDRGRLTAASTLSDIPATAAGQEARTLGFDYVAYHDHRDKGWHSRDAISTQLRDLRNGLQSERKPVYFQEPIPWDRAPGCPGNSPGDPAFGHATAAATFAKRHGAAAWTFHTRSTFNLRSASFVDRLSRDPNQKKALEALTQFR